MMKFVNSFIECVLEFLIIFGVLTLLFFISAFIDRGLLDHPLEIIALYFGIICIVVVFGKRIGKQIPFSKLSFKWYLGAAIVWGLLILLMAGVADLFKQ